MRTLLGQAVAVAILVGFPGISQSVAAGSPEPTLTITLHVHDYAEVDHKTLMEAEKVVTGVLQKAGVQCLWTYIAPTAQDTHEDNVGRTWAGASHVQVNILSRSITERFGRPSSVLGQAPEHSQMVYIFFNHVEELSRSQVKAHMEGIIGRYPSEAQLLGHAIAHELGHLLVSAAHSESGIMHGFWDRKDLLDASYQSLLFTPQQAEIIRAEVDRRNTQQPTDYVAALAVGN